MKLYVVAVTEVYSDIGDVDITPYVNRKAFKTLEEARENMIERYEAAQENLLEYCMDEFGQLEFDSQGYTADGYGHVELTDRRATVSTWNTEGMNNIIEINIEEVEISE